MPPLKKAAKKVAAKHAPHDHAEKDLRRAYEHLGRVSILHPSLDKGMAAQVTELTTLAHQQLAARHNRDAADLLRAAEHLGFGALSSLQAEDAEKALVNTISEEFRHKLEKAEDHWAEQEQHSKALERLYDATVGRAQRAFEEGAFRRALEFVRAAEALAHVKLDEGKHLSRAAEQHALTA